MSSPLVTKDGVTVAEHIELDDSVREHGAPSWCWRARSRRAHRRATGRPPPRCWHTRIFREGAKLVAAGHHPWTSSAASSGRRAVVGALERWPSCRPLRGRRDIAKVATISANGDARVGKLIAEAVDKVGQDGIIHVEQGTALKTKLEVAEGTELERGFLSAYFITDPSAWWCSSTIRTPADCPSKITQVQELIPVMEKVAKTGRSLLVVAEVRARRCPCWSSTSCRGR